MIACAAAGAPDLEAIRKIMEPAEEIVVTADKIGHAKANVFRAAARFGRSKGRSRGRAPAARPDPLIRKRGMSHG